MFLQHLWKTMKKSMVYATYLLLPVVLFCSQPCYHDWALRERLLWTVPKELPFVDGTTNQTDQFLPRNTLPSYHKWYFSVPNPGNSKSSHEQVFSSLWFLHQQCQRCHTLTPQPTFIYSLPLPWTIMDLKLFKIETIKTDFPCLLCFSSRSPTP